MFTLTVLKILLSGGRSVLSPAQRGAGSENWVFSNADIHRFLYWLIECLYVNPMFILDFDFKAIGTYRRKQLFFLNILNTIP